MALSQNEDFITWYLRAAYLNNCKDGSGDRLIHIDNSVLSTPAFKAAGWVVDPISRTHSPPIPTAVNTQYSYDNGALFRADSRDTSEGGMITGSKSNDTIGRGISAHRRRRREQIDDEDSSDLSDESEDDAEAGRAAQQIRFARMPGRDRPDSLPQEVEAMNIGPNVMVTSPSKPGGRKRTGSLGAVEAVKARARADTTTSSEMSSENEVDPYHFRKRQISIPKVSKLTTMSTAAQNKLSRSGAQGQNLDDSDGDSISSAGSSELGETVDSEDILESSGIKHISSTSPILAGMRESATQALSESPKKSKVVPVIEFLPETRPISLVQPKSLLSQALRKETTATNPIQRYAALSGQGSANPLWLKIYAPFSIQPETPYEMPLLRTTKDGEPVTVAETIGLSLWRYGEEKMKPELRSDQLDVNKWVMRLVEYGEVEYDFPPLSRTSVILDFTNNNNRGARARSRGKPFDEFALVEATAQEYEANKRETPLFSPAQNELSVARPAPQERTSSPNVAVGADTRQPTRGNLLLQPFSTALANTTLTPADRPTQIGMTSTPRIGTTKPVRVRFFDLDGPAQVEKFDVPTDSYIEEILDQVCRKWNLDKAGFVLKVAGTTTVAALDRTVEALGTRSDLDLVRKRFGGGPTNLTGSPGSTSPNAPLLLDIQGSTFKKGKKGQKMLHPLAQEQEIMMSATNFKKYYVTRKRVANFSQNTTARVLVFDGDLLHNLPAESGKMMIDTSVKTNTFAFADIEKTKVSTKHSRTIRIVVRRNVETKRYDFEARTAGEAQEIVDEITKEIRIARGSSAQPQNK